MWYLFCRFCSFNTEWKASVSVSNLHFKGNGYRQGREFWSLQEQRQINEGCRHVARGFICYKCRLRVLWIWWTVMNEILWARNTMSASKIYFLETWTWYNTCLAVVYVDTDAPATGRNKTTHPVHDYVRNKPNTKLKYKRSIVGFFLARFYVLAQLFGSFAEQNGSFAYR